MAYASYLYRNRHKTYYLRYTPNRTLLPVLTGNAGNSPLSPVRISLGTKRRPVAQMLSRALVAAIEAHVMTSSTPTAPSDVQTLIRAKLPELRLKLQLEQAEAAHMEALDQLIETKHQRNALSKELVEAEGAQKALEKVLESTIKATQPSPALEPDTSSEAALHSVVEEFIQEHAAAWRPSTLKKNAPILDALVHLIGRDVPISSLNHDRTRAWKREVLNYPANRNSAANKGKSIEALRKAPGFRRIQAKTQQDHFVLATQFGKWAKTQGYLKENYFEGLKPKQKKSAREERSLDDARLLKLFGPQNELYGSKEHVIRTRNPEDHHFWIPLLAALTGGRINELCQLHTVDVQEIDGVWCISINDDAKDKGLKAAASKRLIPLHSYLINAGFLDYVEQIKRRKEKRLFPALSFKDAGGYGTQVSAWCSQFFARCGVKDEAYKQACHSLRHTFINALKQNGVAEAILTELAGHEQASITLSRYSSSYKPTLLKPIVDSISYGFMKERQISYKEWKANRRS